MTEQELFEDLCMPEPNTGCWFWIGPTTKHKTNPFLEYGSFGGERAHRASIRIYRGEVAPKGMVVCHKCDMPLCVNPEHLMIGTYAENAQQCRDRGRMWIQKLKTCVKGHSRTPENTRMFVPKATGIPHRVCIPCFRIARLRSYYRDKAAGTQQPERARALRAQRALSRALRRSLQSPSAPKEEK